ncbi:hypothetical protein PF005_g23394 [Phytophthora fragariae]|uniref:Uncharacterized protein n=1 Tax=Phytophthora fragariae TaxID=53985 RepID=A0A6A3WU89_9STRA|nr:hypothetical protein PF005_g23394 [Phytophthora fragariae]KAE9191191.1 hypothetical protein PF002_g24570 [Phytophthora fragariae]
MTKPRTRSTTEGQQIELFAGGLLEQETMYSHNALQRFSAHVEYAE